MDHDNGAGEAANLVAGAHAAVLHHHVGIRNVTTGVGQEAAKRRQQRAKLFVDGVRVEAVRHDDLDLWVTRQIQPRERAGVVFTQPLTERWMRQVVIPARGGRAHAHVARARVADDTLVKRRIQRAARMHVDAIEPRVRIRRVHREVQAPVSQLPELPRCLLLEQGRLTAIARVPRVRRVETRERLTSRPWFAIRPERAKRDQSLLHRRGHLPSSATAQRRMLPERGRQVPEHRVGVPRHCHEIGRRGSMDEALGHETQLARRDAHVKRRAHIEAHRQAVQFRHHRVLEAGALELLSIPEHFRPDEAGDIVHDGPSVGRIPLGTVLARGGPADKPTTDVTRDAVRSRFQRAHVDPLGCAVGHLRPLPGLEVQPVEAAREVEHAIDVEAHHPSERP